MASVRGSRARGLGLVGVLALAPVFVVGSATRADAAVTVTVDPSTALADGQPVTITGTGFTPGASVGAAECSAAIAQSHNTSDCDLSNAPITQADSSGTAVLHLRARVTINTANGTIDCVTAPDPCIVGMGDTSDLMNSEKTGGSAITFDPNAPPVPPPSVTFNPSGELLDRQQIAVYATGFIPGEFVSVLQCAAQNLDKTPCNESFGFGYPGNGAQADPTGAVAFGLTVRRAIRVDNERFDCASTPGACLVVVQASGGPAGTAPLGFDPTVPLPPPPVLTITPADGLGDGEIVQAHGEGFTPNAPVALLQCPSDANPVFGGCSAEYGRYLQADASGVFTAGLKVEREQSVFGPTPQPTTVDCAESAGRCVVTAFDYNDDLDSDAAPISFDPSKPPAPDPVATVSPSTPLADGQAVTLRGDGFGPGSSLFLVECVDGATDASGCDLSQLTSVLADDNGHVEAPYTVKRFLTLGPPVPPPPTATTVAAASAEGRPAPAAASFFDVTADRGTFDCASAPGACVLSLAFLGGPQVEFASAPLTFDPNAPPATPTTTAPGPEQPTDASGGGGSSIPTTTTQTTTAPTVEGEALARTGTDVRNPLRYDLLLLVVGAVALVGAAALRARAHRRASRAEL